MTEPIVTPAQCADMDETAEWAMENADALAELGRKPRASHGQPPPLTE